MGLLKFYINRVSQNQDKENFADRANRVAKPRDKAFEE